MDGGLSAPQCIQDLGLEQPEPPELAPRGLETPLAPEQWRASLETLGRSRSPLIESPLPIPVVEEEQRVIGVDASALPVGATRRGVVVAVRAVVVSKTRSSAYSVKRLGPIPFIIPHERMQDGEPQDPLTLLEALARNRVLTRAAVSIVLLDGRLQPSRGERSLWQGLLAMARARRNTVISLSKEPIPPYTSLSRSVRGFEPPFVAGVRGLQRRGSPGAVFAVRLAAPGLVFLSTHCPPKPVEEAARDYGRVLYNDIVEAGYPETLRLAHIFAKLTPLEAIAVRHAVQERTGVEVQKQSDVRRMLFGPLWS